MKKLFVLQFLVLNVFLASASFAEWRLVIRDDDSRDAHYIDPSSIEYKNGYVYFEVLVDYGTPVARLDVQSMKVYKKTDCDSSSHADMILSYVAYSGQMSQGEIITSRQAINRKMNYDNPSQIGYKVIEEVCSIARDER